MPKPASYDRVPYKCYPNLQSQPERLATIGTLLGMKAPAVATARVLELGCSGGGNLIPLAERFPEVSFVGIDASGRQVEEAQGVAKLASTFSDAR
jgi:tRNA G46 methylase TrmB